MWGPSKVIEQVNKEQGLQLNLSDLESWVPQTPPNKSMNLRTLWMKAWHCIHLGPQDRLLSTSCPGSWFHGPWGQWLLVMNTVVNSALCELRKWKFLKHWHILDHFVQKTCCILLLHIGINGSFKRVSGLSKSHMSSVSRELHQEKQFPVNFMNIICIAQYECSTPWFPVFCAINDPDSKEVGLGQRGDREK